MVGYEQGAPCQLGQTEVFFAGAAAGFLARFISQPLDVLKVKFQLQVEPISQTSEASKYRSLAHAVRVLWKEEGPRAFWSGHNPGQLLSIIYGAVNMVLGRRSIAWMNTGNSCSFSDRSAPRVVQVNHHARPAIKFSTYQFLTRVSHDYVSSERGVAVNFVCGFGAGSAATFASYPFDVLRTRFIAQGTKHVTSHSYRSMINGLVKMVRREGITAPYKGLLPALVQNAPLVGISFATHSVIKSFLDKMDAFTNSNNRLNLSGNMIAGAAAGFVSKTAVYPLDLARRRIQFQGFQDARIGYGKNFTCWGFVDCIRNVLREEGLRGLFKGYVPSAVKTSISTSLYFTVFEELCDMIKFIKQTESRS